MSNKVPSPPPVNGQPQPPILRLVGPIRNSIQPVPIEVSLGEAFDQATRTKLVILQISTASGVSIYFLDQASAKTLGENLQLLGAGIIPADGSLAQHLANAAIGKAKPNG